MIVTTRGAGMAPPQCGLDLVDCVGAVLPVGDRTAKSTEVVARARGQLWGREWPHFSPLMRRVLVRARPPPAACRGPHGTSL